MGLFEEPIERGPAFLTDKGQILGSFIGRAMPFEPLWAKFR